MLLSKEMQARDEAQLPPTEAEAASGQPAGQYLNPPILSGFKFSAKCDLNFRLEPVSFFKKNCCESESAQLELC